MKRKTLAMLEKQRQAAIRRDMGFFDFYFQPQQRRYYDSKYPPTTADQLVQMDNTTIEEKLARMALGQGSVAFVDTEAALEAEQKKDEEEEAIVEGYKLIDANMAELGKAAREGRRIQYKPDKSKKKQKKQDFAAKQYRLKIMDVAHGKVDPNGADPDQ